MSAASRRERLVPTVRQPLSWSDSERFGFSLHTVAIKVFSFSGTFRNVGVNSMHKSSKLFVLTLLICTAPCRAWRVAKRNDSLPSWLSSHQAGPPNDDDIPVGALTDEVQALAGRLRHAASAHPRTPPEPAVAASGNRSPTASQGVPFPAHRARAAAKRGSPPAGPAHAQPAAAAAAKRTNASVPASREVVSKTVSRVPEERLTNAKELARRSFWAQREGGNEGACLVLTATGERLLDVDGKPLRKFSKGAGYSWPRTPPPKDAQRSKLTSTEALLLRRAALKFEDVKVDAYKWHQFWDGQKVVFSRANQNHQSRQHGVWAANHLTTDALKHWAQKGLEVWDWKGTRTDEGKAAISAEAARKESEKSESQRLQEVSEERARAQRREKRRAEDALDRARERAAQPRTQPGPNMAAFLQKKAVREAKKARTKNKAEDTRGGRYAESGAKGASWARAQEPGNAVRGGGSSAVSGNQGARATPPSQARPSGPSQSSASCQGGLSATAPDTPTQASRPSSNVSERKTPRSPPRGSASSAGPTKFRRCSQ